MVNLREQFLNAEKTKIYSPIILHLAAERLPPNSYSTSMSRKHASYGFLAACCRIRKGCDGHGKDEASYENDDLRLLRILEGDVVGLGF